MFVRADANYCDQARLAGEEAVALLGSIDVLVNSTVGLVRPELFHDISIDSIPDILMCRVALPSMHVQKSGLIINVASDAAKIATPGETVIGAVMAGIVMFSRTLAVEAKRDGIRVNVLTPSLVEDTATAERMLAGGFSQSCWPGRAGRIPRRTGWRQDYRPSHKRERRNLRRLTTSCETVVIAWIDCGLDLDHEASHRI